MNFVEVAMKGQRILVVDDEPLMQEFLIEALERNSYHVDMAESGKEALEKINNNFYHLVITDVRMPNIGGMEILKETKRKYPESGVIMVTAYGTVESAVEAMKQGAFDYITKPFSIDEIELVVNKFFEYNRLVSENRYLRSELEKQYAFENIIGRSPKMKQVFEIVEMVAPTKATVLIQGASGTGKELIAKAIHFRSPRRDRPFVKTNCAALPVNLVESELFGHEKGAFTGAIKRTKGRFELADGGTLLLDEISEMSPNLQAKLLRVLQEKEFEKVGNSETVQVDIRIIATTNRDLKEEVAKGNFREDLYYRLNVVPIFLPTLKERKEDIPLLAEYFVRKYAQEVQKKISGISDEVTQMLMEYDWPGNVRELEHAIERAVIIAKEEILQPQHFLMFREEFQLRNRENITVNNKTLYEMEKQWILQVLREQNWNRTRAAEVLGISVRTLRNKIRQFRNSGIVIPG